MTASERSLEEEGGTDPAGAGRPLIGPGVAGLSRLMEPRSVGDTGAGVFFLPDEIGVLGRRDKAKLS